MRVTRRGFLKVVAGGAIATVTAPEILLPERRVFALDSTMIPSQDLGSFFWAMESTDTPFLEEMRRLQMRSAKELEDALIYGKDHEDFDIVIVPGGGKWLSRDRGWIEW